MDGVESLGGGEAKDGHFVDAVLAPEPEDLGGLLEFLDEGVEVAFVEEVGDYGFETRRRRGNRRSGRIGNRVRRRSNGGIRRKGAEAKQVTGVRDSEKGSMEENWHDCFTLQFEDGKNGGFCRV